MVVAGRVGRVLRASLIATSCLGVYAPGLAQETSIDAAERVEEIVVTARKREENIQDTPISITALSASGLEARNAVDLTDIAETTPNLTINTSAAFSGSSQTAAVFIRGIGQTDFTLNTDPGVGIYVDGVYISRAVGSLLDLADVERVEVLRGPQGTLFGKNTIGGAISIVTEKPSFEPKAKATAFVGSDDWAWLSANVTGPIGDRIAAKMFARYERRDGHVKRITDGEDLGNRNSFDMRLGLLAEASDDLSILLNADYTRSRENGAPLVLRGEQNPNGLFAIIHNALVAPALEPTLGARAFYTSQYVPSDVYRVEGEYPAYSNADTWGVSANAEYDLGSVTLRSITAYRNVDSEFARDADGSPLLIGATQDEYDYNQFSQELQALGTAADGRLNYVAGLFYLDEEGRNPNIVDLSAVRFLSGGRVRNTSQAAFGQATYDLTDQLSVTAGIRYTEETRRFTPEQRVLEQRVTLPIPPFPAQLAILNLTAGQPLVTAGRVTAKSSEWTPTLSVAYEPIEQVLAYASYSRGFKGGGFTQRIFPPNFELGPNGPTGRLLPPPAFAPETANVYEVGVKLNSPDNRARLNAAAFYTDYQDLQVTVQVGVAPTTQNAAAATVKGFEIETQLVPVDGLRIDAGVGYTDAEYDRLDQRVTALTLASKLPGTSKWTLNGAASYEVELSGGSTLTPRVDWTYRSGFFFDANNMVAEDGYGAWNASLTYRAERSGFEVAAFVQNIGDELYFTHGEFLADVVGFNAVSPSRGREWGLRVSKTF